MKKTTIAALLGSALLTTGTIATVQAQTSPQDAPKHRMMRDPMMMADTNKDGIVTRDETIAAVTARFAKLDANKDGKITVEERKAARAAMRAEMGDRKGDKAEGRMGKRMRGGPDGHGMKRGPGANGDGSITLEEQRTQALKRFDFVDRNSDGKIDQTERETVRSMLREMGGKRGGHGGRGHGRHHGGGMPAAPATGS
ncbi:MAG: ca2+ sensor protein [Sphingomonadales bacterium]|nr:MAG: ca2+ sensor protein [Sphingomonadales bacterium]